MTYVIICVCVCEYISMLHTSHEILWSSLLHIILVADGHAGVKSVPGVESMLRAFKKLEKDPDIYVPLAAKFPAGLFFSVVKVFTPYWSPENEAVGQNIPLFKEEIEVMLNAE